MRVESRQDEAFDFDRVRSFAFAPEKADPGGATDLRAPVRREIERRLTERGYAVVPDTADADLWVAFHVREQQQTSYTTHETWGEHVGGTEVWVRQRTHGNLVIDFVDPKSRKIVWHGHAHETVYADMNRQQEVAEAVAKILARFPAGG